MSSKSLYPLVERVRVGIEFLNYLHEHGASTAQDFSMHIDVDYKLLISAILLLKHHGAIHHENDNYVCKTWVINPKQDITALTTQLTTTGSANTQPLETANNNRPNREERCQKFWGAFLRGKPINNLSDLD